MARPSPPLTLLPFRRRRRRATDEQRLSPRSRCASRAREGRVFKTRTFDKGKLISVTSENIPKKILPSPSHRR